jgi:shikimate dehydrogenase
VEFGPRVRACALAALTAPGGIAAADAVEASAFDLILNATAASLSDELPALSPALLHERTVCYDLAYALRDTAFVAWARRVGAAAAYDGLGMLVEQAAEAFERWHGVRPDTAAVLGALRGTDSASGRRPQ